MKKPAAQFNSQKGDTVIVERRKRGRLVRRILTVVRTGIENEHGCPLSFLAAGKGSRRVKLAPFEDSADLRIVILPRELPAELAGFQEHPSAEFAWNVRPKTSSSVVAAGGPRTEKWRRQPSSSVPGGGG